MKNSVRAVILISLLAASPLAMAKGGGSSFESMPKWEFAGTTAASLLAGSSTTIQVSASVGYTVNSWFEPTFLTNISNISNNGHITSLSFLIGPTINFPMGNDDARNAFFLSALGGIQNTSIGGNSGALSVSASATEFDLLGTVGKRFEISDSVTYRPATGVSWVNGSTANFVLIPFSFSLFL